MSETKPFVFISYARKDGREYAERLYRDLTAHGYDAWWDERSLDYYQDFTADIEKALKRASHVVVCLTQDSLESDGYVRRELNYAILLKKPIIPARFEDVLPPIQIANLIWIDFWKGTWENSFDAVDSRLKLPIHEWKGRFGEAESFADPFADYLQSLYQSIVDYIGQTVFSEITLRSKATADAVKPSEKPAPTIKTRVMGKAIPIHKPAPMPTTEPEQVEFENFAGAFEHFKGRVLLLGEPGAGKSTTLLAFARDMVSKRLSDASAPLPVFGRIAEWDALKAPSIADWLTEGEDEETARRIKAEIDAGRALLLLDGLDELGGEREHPTTKEKFDPRLKFIQAIPDTNQVLLTCRVTDYAAIREKAALNGAVTLQPLSDAQIEAYLSDHDDLWAAVQADAELMAMARTPLLLSIFTVAFEELGDQAAKLRDVAKSPGDLRDAIFRRYVERRWEHEAARSPEPLAYDVEGLYRELGEMAAENVRGFLSRNNVLQRSEIPSRLLELAQRLNLLARIDETTVRFAHLLLRDNFAFVWVMHALADVNAGRRYMAAEVLGELGDARAVEPLIGALDDSEIHVRNRAEESLGELKDVRAFEPLSRLLTDIDSMTRERAALTLGQLGDARAVEPLIEALGDMEVRGSALAALGALGDARAVEPLIAVLGDASVNVRIIAAEALGRLGDGRAVEPLIAVLEDANMWVRKRAAEALRKIGTPEALAAVEEWRKRQG